MRWITFRADEILIDRARAVARAEGRTLSAAFRQWLEQYSDREADVAKYRKLMARLRYVRAGRHFTRDEMNER